MKGNLTPLTPLSEAERGEKTRSVSSQARSASKGVLLPLLRFGEGGWGGEVAFLLLILFAPTLHAAEISVTLGELKAGALIDQEHLKKLSQQLQLTVWVEGPGPLEVTSPKPVLVGRDMWRVFEDGLPLREVLANGRQRWQQVYRLSPLDVRDQAVIKLTPLTVRAGNQKETVIDWGDAALFVKVESSVKVASADSLRDPADIEKLPPPPTTTSGSFNWLIVVVPLCLVIALVLILVARRKKSPALRHDAEWALRELTDTVSPDQCARVLREYVGFRQGIDARPSTTAELLARLQLETRWTAELRQELQALLDTCDQVRFSGTETTALGLGEQARAWVQRVEEAFRTPAASPNLGVEVG